MTDFTPPTTVEPLSPDRARHLYQQAQIALRSQDYVGAVQIAQTGLAEGMEHPEFLTLVADFHQQQGDYDGALRLLQRAAFLAPNDPSICNGAGYCLVHVGRDADAMKAYDQALAIDPRYVRAWYNKARLHEKLSEISEAIHAYEMTIALDASMIDAAARRAWLAVQQGDWDTAERWADRTLSLDPHAPAALLTQVQLLIRKGRPEEALGIALELERQPRIGAVNLAFTQSLKGDAYDALGRTDEAYTSYEMAGYGLREHFASWLATLNAGSPPQEARRIEAEIVRAPVFAWTPDTRATQPVASHTFLMGFPRSGTTLLGAMLAAGDKVAVSDEKDTLYAHAQALMATSPDFERMLSMDSATAEDWRDRYWRTVKSATAFAGDSVFIDKMPLYTTLLPMIAKVFPRARVLFAVRDPRDVVWSSFRRRFRINPSMNELLTLESAAIYYDAVMSVAAASFDKLPTQIHQVRYEALVENPEAVLKPVCEFIGAHFSPAMLRPDAAALDSATPSAAQIGDGVHAEGVGQWRPYAKHMETIMPILTPWVKKFGYSET